MGVVAPGMFGVCALPVLQLHQWGGFMWCWGSRTLSLLSLCPPAGKCSRCCIECKVLLDEDISPMKAVASTARSGLC